MAKRRRRRISLQANFDQEFTDLTIEPLVYQYPEEEVVEGMRFKHMQKGVYKAAECLMVSKKKIKDIGKRYSDLIFWGYEKEEKFEIRYALSKVGCSLDYYSWWEDEIFTNCAEIAEQKEEICKMKGFYPDDYAKCSKYMKFAYERVVCEDGTVPRIMINGYIADMVEQGIYYFPKQKGDRRPKIDINISFKDKDVAAVFCWDYGITPYIFLKYVATDKKYFPRLKEIGEMEEGYWYYEFQKESDNNEGHCPIAPDVEVASKNPLEPEGEELISGLGTENVTLSFEVPLIEKREFKKYLCAYKVEDTLVLIQKVGKKTIREEFNMRLMTQLNVKKEVLLNSGYWYDAILKIIDCREEKYREILTPEAYRLYEEINKRKCINIYSKA